MVVPIVKFGFVCIKVFTRPFSVVLLRRIKQTPHPGLHWFGLKCFRFEHYLKEKLNETTHNYGIKIEVLDEEKISRRAAETKGAEYLIELIFFYGVIFGIVVYEYQKR